MKKILIILCLIFSYMTLTSSVVHAASTVEVEVTEKIPGANCDEEKNENGNYDCDIETGFSGVTSIMGNIIQYFTYITALAAVLYIVINGILYSMSGMDAGLKDSAKKRIINTLLGLILLLLAGVILNAIAPWIYTA